MVVFNNIEFYRTCPNLTRLAIGTSGGNPVEVRFSLAAVPFCLHLEELIIRVPHHVVE